jgi:hypothetical protein
MTPLKPKNDFESPNLILKKTSSKTISWVNMSLTPLKPILATFEAIILANTKPYANRF